MSRPSKKQEANPYATAEDFRNIFDQDLDGLYQLAYVLTADHEKAEQAFVGGVEDAIKSNRVFKEWAHSWAKRVVVQNAIRLMQPRTANPGEWDASYVTPNSNPRQLTPPHFALQDVLALGQFERFVFVLTVLEHYNDREAGLQLGCMVMDVRQARAKALDHIANSIRPAVEDSDAPIPARRFISRMETRGRWAGLNPVV